MAKLSYTRPQLEKILTSGGSVMLPGGRHITRIEDLPSDVELAGGDKAQLEDHVKHLHARQAALAREIADAEAKLGEAESAEEEAREKAEAAEHDAPKAHGKRGRGRKTAAKDEESAGEESGAEGGEDKPAE